MVLLVKVSPDHPAVKWLNRQQEHFKLAFDRNTLKPSDHVKYRNKLVKDAILEETFKKCAYCETLYAATDWGNVEHINPKSGNPRDRTLEYKNLTLACSVCNGNKSDHEGLINPYEIDPREVLMCCGPLYMPQYDPNKFVIGEQAIRLLGLNRPDLVEKRSKFLRDCHDAVREYCSPANEGIRLYASLKINAMRSSKAEYSFFAHDFFAKSGV